MNISIMSLDSNPTSKQKINDTVHEINEGNGNYSIANESAVNISIHESDNFTDTIDTINRYKIDIIIINISSIAIDQHIEECIQLRNVYSFAPIIAISEPNHIPKLDHYSYIGFDDILSTDVITENILIRVINSAIQRSKNYHLFHTNNQRKVISSQLLELLIDKKPLDRVANLACKIINAQSSNSPYSFASIYSIEDGIIDRIAHSGTDEEEKFVQTTKDKISTLINSERQSDDFNYVKNNTNSHNNRISVTIPLKNKSRTFAFLKIETDHGIVHPTEERRYYKDISKTLSDVFILAQERERFEQIYKQNVRLIDEMSSAAIGIDKHDRVTHWNHQAEVYFGINNVATINMRLFDLNIDCDWPIIISNLYDSLNKNVTSNRFEVSYKRSADDKDRLLSVAITPFVEPNGTFSGYLLLMDDITEKTHMEKRHQQSMYLESIGQLSAGIAHEINTPMQYISDNLNFLKDSFSDTAKALRTIKKHLIEKTLDENKLDEIFEEADFEYLSDELPLAFSQTTEGVKRVCAIVKAMKEYSHPNSEEKVATNINNCIESTVTISKHTWKYHSEMEVDLDPELPEVMCHPGPFNEVILNIVVNAADAIRERIENNSDIHKGAIKIQTKKQPEFAEIRISDTGGGIPQKIQEKIFDPFFTTKEVGKGTGQGLSLSYSIIKERHNGELYFETVPGESTTFILQLPYQSTSA